MGTKYIIGAIINPQKEKINFIKKIKVPLLFSKSNSNKAHYTTIGNFSEASIINSLKHAPEDSNKCVLCFDTLKFAEEFISHVIAIEKSKNLYTIFEVTVPNDVTIFDCKLADFQLVTNLFIIKSDITINFNVQKLDFDIDPEYKLEEPQYHKFYNISG